MAVVYWSVILYPNRHPELTHPLHNFCFPFTGMLTTSRGCLAKNQLTGGYLYCWCSFLTAPFPVVVSMNCGCLLLAVFEG